MFSSKTATDSVYGPCHVGFHPWQATASSFSTGRVASRDPSTTVTGLRMESVRPYLWTFPSPGQRVPRLSGATAPSTHKPPTFAPALRVVGRAPGPQLGHMCHPLLTRMDGSRRLPGSVGGSRGWAEQVPLRKGVYTLYPTGRANRVRSVDGDGGPACQPPPARTQGTADDTFPHSAPRTPGTQAPLERRDTLQFRTS